MVAYAALISLSNTIDRLLNHNQISISLEKKQQLLSLLEHVNSFEAFLEKFPDKFNILEGRMRDLAHEAEDMIEYFMLNQLSYFQKAIMTLATSSTATPIPTPILKDSMGCWFRRFIHPPRRNNKDKEHADSFVCKDGMVGLDDLVIKLKDRLCGEPSTLQVIPICGMGGIGKTTIAKYLYNDPLIVEHFEIRVWVKLSQDYNVKTIFPSILESLEEYTKVVKRPYDEKVSEVCKILAGKRYLIVMDNIWSSGACHYLIRGLPDNRNGSRVMLTTILRAVASRMYPSRKLYEMRLLNEYESWDLLKWKVFGDEECPSELENIGKEIARCCKGWPVALAMIAGILSTTTRTCASWKEWADEYCDESQHLEKVMEEIGLIAGEVREIKDSLSSSNYVERGVASSASLISSSSADLIIHDSNTLQLRAAASSSGSHDKTRFLSAKFSKFKSKHHMQKVRKVFDSIAGKVMSTKKNNNSNGVQCGAASSAALSSSSTAPPIHKDAMVGFDDYLLDLKNRLCGGPSKKLQVIPICGMGGIGKTTLARNVYTDPLITNHFDIRVWVTISQDFSTQRILSSLVESLKEFDKGGLGQNDDEKVHKILFGRRYLVVMDDIWSSKAWDVVRRVFPDDGNGSRVMLTTRLSYVASYPDPSSKLCEMSLLNADESWNLLKKNVFEDEDCPSDLQDIGRKIARSCKGLPLAIIVIAGLLSTTMRNLVSWRVIAENVKSAEHDQIEDILALSYVHLPQYLRPCFLYMGSFLEDETIDVSRLIRLWVAEGFVKSPIDSDNFEKVAEEFLEELVKRNLVLVTKRDWDGRIKSCSLHDLMRDLCIRKSHESKFFLNTRDSRIGKESFIENIRKERRVSVDFFNLKFFSSLHGSTIRSIKCSGNHRNYSWRLDFLESVRLLRVLDGEHFYMKDMLTPGHLDELLHLRYLTITYSRELLLSLSRLRNLQTLVILEPRRSRCSRCSLQLKWCMSQLRHVYCYGTIDFEDPKETDCPLESLQTLSYVSLSTCRERILKMIPNLKKLQINCSKGLPRDGGVCLDDLVHLHRLETLEIYAGKEVTYYKGSFPRMLKKLILRQWKLPLNDVFVFGSLPNLQVLELLDCACVGGTWETTEGEFSVLEVLKMSNSSLENWVTESSHFPRLKLLLLHECEVLRGIPNDLGEIPTLELIEVMGSVRKSLIDSVELIREEQEDMGNDTLQVVHYDAVFCYDDDGGVMVSSDDDIYL